MDRDDLFRLLTRLRRAPLRGTRAPHKPLLVLWLLGRMDTTGSSAASYAELREPVGRLIDDFGPPLVGRSAQRAAWPFAKLERELWEPRYADGSPVAKDATGRTLMENGAVGRFVSTVDALLAESGVRRAAAQLLLDLHFTPVLAPLIADACGIDLEARIVVPPMDRADVTAPRRARRAGFPEEVLMAYSYACAVCGFDGKLGRNPIGLEAAHVRWHSQGGPDELTNALTLCSLHHVLLDVGAIGVTPTRTLTVSPTYVATSPAGRAVDDLRGAAIRLPRPASRAPTEAHLDWHRKQVFKAAPGRTVISRD